MSSFGTPISSIDVTITNCRTSSEKEKKVHKEQKKNSNLNSHLKIVRYKEKRAKTQLTQIPIFMDSKQCNL